MSPSRSITKFLVVCTYVHFTCRLTVISDLLMQRICLQLIITLKHGFLAISVHDICGVHYGEGKLGHACVLHCWLEQKLCHIAHNICALQLVQQIFI